MVARSLPATWDWRPIGVALYVAVNLSLTLVLVRPENGPDWQLWRAIGSGNPYRLDTIAPYVWSPLLVPVMQVVGWLGPVVSVAMHVGAVLLLRSRLLILLTLASWAFWTDAGAGNTFAYVFVAGALALRGNRWGVIASFVLFLLMPRPIQFPLVAWLVWQHRDLWRWYVGLFVAHAVTVLATGLAFDWIGGMLAYGQEPEYDIGPTMWFGTAWLIVGIPLGLFLAWRGRVGWAALAMTTYLMPQYLLAPLWELVPQHRKVDDRLRRQRIVDQPVPLGGR